MSSTTDKIKGLANEAVGNVKQGIGNATDTDTAARRDADNAPAGSAASG